MDSFPQSAWFDWLPRGLVRLWLVFRSFWNHHKAKTWPLISGRVEDISVEERVAGRSFRTFYQAELSYSYEVAGEFYSGSFSPPMFEFEEESHRFAQHFQTGRNVKLHYNPTHPGESVLLLEDQREFAGSA